MGVVWAKMGVDIGQRIYRWVWVSWGGWVDRDCLHVLTGSHAAASVARSLAGVLTSSVPLPILPLAQVLHESIPCSSAYDPLAQRRQPVQLDCVHTYSLPSVLVVSFVCSDARVPSRKVPTGHLRHSVS
jgi:hypothetical protein